jgi:signal transduction histidine kinase
MEAVDAERTAESAEPDLRKDLANARKTVAVLMDRIEKMAASSHAPTGLNLNNLAVQQMVRQRTADLQRLNEGLMEAAIQHKRTDRIIREMQRIANIGGWELNVETRSMEITDQMKSMCGRSLECGPSVDNFCALFTPQHSELLQQHINAAHTKRDQFDLELETLSSDGPARTFRVVGRPLIEGKTVGSVYGVAMDISQQKAAEFQISQSQRLESIGQLAAGIAHEINTPTQYVGDNTRFIRESLASIIRLLHQQEEVLGADAEAKPWAVRAEEFRKLRQEIDLDFLLAELPKALDQSVEGLESISKIVRAMKEFSHPGGDVKEPTDLNSAIESTTVVCRNRWKFVADLEFKFDPALPNVPVLRGEFNQVMLNLIVNAADAIAEASTSNSAQKGRIEITTRTSAGCVEVLVQDNGPGIPPTVARRIFEPFFTTKPVGKGTGQGLTISRNVIVKKHGGELKFEPAVGGGTVFIIRLPLTNCDPDSSEGA